MRVLLVPFGSHGDVHPFVGLGQALRARGHRVTFLINEYFGPLIRGLGFEMVPIGEAELFAEGDARPRPLGPAAGLRRVSRAVLEHARLAYPRIEELYVPGETVAVGGSLAFAVRLRRRSSASRRRRCTSSRAILHSNFETPAYPGFKTPRWWPTWFRRPFFNLVFARAVDPHVRPV